MTVTKNVDKPSVFSIYFRHSNRMICYYLGIQNGRFTDVIYLTDAFKHE